MSEEYCWGRNPHQIHDNRLKLLPLRLRSKTWLTGKMPNRMKSSPNRVPLLKCKSTLRNLRMCKIQDRRPKCQLKIPLLNLKSNKHPYQGKILNQARRHRHQHKMPLPKPESSNHRSRTLKLLKQSRRIQNRMWLLRNLQTG